MRYRKIAGTAAVTALAALLTMGATDCQPTTDDPQAAASGEVSVPITVLTGWRGTTVLVSVQVNGHGPFDFLLDTGASKSVIDRSLARRLHLPDTGRDLHFEGVGSGVEAPMVSVHRWTVGGRRLYSSTMPAIDLGSLRCQGMLGSDELRRLGAVIDYRKRRLVVRSPT